VLIFVKFLRKEEHQMAKNKKRICNGSLWVGSTSGEKHIDLFHVNQGVNGFDINTITEVVGDLVIDCGLDTSEVKLRDGLRVGGSLSHRYHNIDLPKNLYVGENLEVYYFEGKIPTGLVVIEELHLTVNREDVKIEFPDDTLIGGLEIQNRIAHNVQVKLPPKMNCSEDVLLSYCDIEKLPDNMRVGINCRLCHSRLPGLPRGMYVAGLLDLSHSNVTELPPDLIVGGDLILQGTSIKEIPDTVIIGGCVNLSGTKVKRLPEKFKIGGYVNFRGSRVRYYPKEITNAVWYHEYVNKMKPADLVEHHIEDEPLYFTDKYATIDGLLCEIVAHKGNVYRVKMNPAKDEITYVVTDGKFFAHGDTLKDAKEDLLFKGDVNSSVLDEYKKLKPTSRVSASEAKVMYHNITRACRTGINEFINRKFQGKVPRNLTIQKMAEMSSGGYGSLAFCRFFGITLKD
jgi:hypothetical protein